MSDLDDIYEEIVQYDYELMDELKREKYKAKSKQQIKELMLGLIDNTMLYGGGFPDASINLAEIRRKVEEL